MKDSDIMQISDIRNKHDGERCAILFNGPTLTDHDLSKIDCVTIGINRSWMVHQSDYYIAIDEINWRLYEKEKNKKLQPLITSQDGPDHAIKVNITDPVPPVVGDMMSSRIGWSWDIEKGAFLFYAVSHLAFQVAAYMGFTTIFPLGLDMCGKREQGEMRWKFRSHPDAWKSREGRFDHQQALMACAWENLKGKVRILNLSPKSECYAFPKGIFEEEFDGRGKGRINHNDQRLGRLY